MILGKRDLCTGDDGQAEIVHQHGFGSETITFMAPWPPNNTLQCCMKALWPHLWCLLLHLVLHPLGLSQILDPQLSVLDTPLPQQTGSLLSLYYYHMESHSTALDFFTQCNCAQLHKATFLAPFSAISQQIRPAATRMATICQNVFLQIFYAL